MGLPIWRDPEEKKTTDKNNGPSKPPAALDRVASSRIQRRASIHGPRSRARAAQRRQHFLAYPPPLSPVTSIPRLTDTIIPTLLETVDSNTPPPAPEATRFSNQSSTSTQEPEDRESWSRARRIGQRRRLLEDTNRLTSSLSRSYPLSLPSAEPGENPTQYEIRTANDIMDVLINNSLPTPPGEAPTVSSPDATQQAQNTSRIDGLGDRNRSPTPAETLQAHESWSPLRSTIAPDTTLPSLDSSFTTAAAAASRSFASSSISTSITGDDEAGTSRQDDQSASVSSIDVDDLCADEDDEESGMLNATEALASDFYLQEFESPEGRERIIRHERLQRIEGNRFAVAGEPPNIDVGFRLIEETLERVEEQRRADRLSNDSYRDELNEHLARLTRLNDSNRRRVRELARSTAAQAGAEISIDAPQAYPVNAPSQPTPQSMSELVDVESDGQDLDAMRRIVERLAARDDVPEEWWLSMGLNLSRSRPRRSRPANIRDARLLMMSGRHRRAIRSGETDRDRESRL